MQMWTVYLFVLQGAGTQCGKWFISWLQIDEGKIRVPIGLGWDESRLPVWELHVENDLLRRVQFAPKTRPEQNKHLWKYKFSFYRYEETTTTMVILWVTVTWYTCASPKQQMWPERSKNAIENLLQTALWWNHQSVLEKPNNCAVVENVQHPQFIHLYFLPLSHSCWIWIS